MLLGRQRDRDQLSWRTEEVALVLFGFEGRLFVVDPLPRLCNPVSLGRGFLSMFWHVGVRLLGLVLTTEQPLAGPTGPGAKPMRKLNTILSAVLLAACGFDSAGCFKEPIEAVGTSGDDLGEDDLGDDDSSSDGGSSEGTTGEPEDETGEGTGDHEDDTGTETGTETGDMRCYAYLDGSTFVSVLNFSLEGPFTIEMWAKLESDDPGVTSTVGFEFRTDTNDGFRMSVRDDRFVAAFFPNDVHEHQTAIREDQWAHVAWVFDLDQSWLFLDGVLLSTETIEPAYDGEAADLWIGAYKSSNGDLQGYRTGAIRDVRVSSVARYGAGGFSPAVRLVADDETFLLLTFDEDIKDAAGGHDVEEVGSLDWRCD